MTQNNYDAIIILNGTSGAEATCSVHRSPAGWHSQRTLGVGFSRLPRTEAGTLHSPTDHLRKLAPAKVVKLPFYEPKWKKK